MQRAIAIAATALLFAAPTHAADELPPIESFFKLSQYASMRLSPDGQHIAALSPIKDKQGLVIIDVKNRKATPIAARTDRDIVSAEWISDKRLLYTTGRLGERDAQQRGGGIFAIDLDGAAPRLISEGIDEQKGVGMRATIRPLEILRTLPGDTDDVIAQEIVIGGGAPVAGPLYRLDTRTGRKTDISIGKPDSGPFETWRVDSSGTARAFIVTSPDEGTRVYYRAGADAPWKKLDEFKATSAAAWSPVGLAPDGRTLYVSSRKDGDRAAIFRYDPETRTLGDVVAQHPQVDLQTLFGDKEGVRGVRYNADKPGTAWFDSNLASAQTTVDNTLPGYVNVLSWSRDRNLVLIESFSDVSPGSFYLFDRATNKIEWLADRRPWIDPKKMSPMQPVRYKARDGLEIPAYLTIPRGSSGKALPMVVLVHGGPWVPGDSWGWNPEVQFLASRGYAVLQPNYRGTTHYGWKHFASSFKQWGLTMQDDITDGVSWAVAQGVADPKRVCIYGGSYGGYAAMMGVAKTPEVFKCAINYVGVTDLPLHLTASWTDFFNSEITQNVLKSRLGDIDREADRLKATSPTELAGRIKAPVLMAYGGSDVRVIPEHGTRMRAALERAGNKPEWMIVDEEGHGYRKLENQVMFYGAMEKFLEKNIGSSQ